MIKFSWENIDVPALDFENVRKWIVEVAKIHGFSVGNLSYLFCDDKMILDANRKFLGHDYFTDIITFDYTHAGRIGGDMFISVETVASNAVGIGVDADRELLRVVIHGVLHLCGIDDKGPGEREIMEMHEDAALAIWDACFA